MEERVFTPEATDQWLWIAVLGGFAAFYAAFGIGANDVANAFATSVAADTLSTQQALAMASVFELLGAILLGAHVSEAIRADIVDVSEHKSSGQHDPPICNHSHLGEHIKQI